MPTTITRPKTNETICLTESRRFAGDVDWSAARVAVIGPDVTWAAAREQPGPSTLTSFPQSTYHHWLARGEPHPAPGQIRSTALASVPCAAEGTKDMNDETTALPAAETGSPEGDRETASPARQPAATAV